MKTFNLKGQWMEYRLNGKEKFILNGEQTDMDIADFWRWHFCDRFDLQDKMAEYIVAKALGKKSADNIGSWTLFDIMYRNKRIEVKETSYYHSWQSDEEPKSKARNFRIAKAYSEYKDAASSYERQNDIYVFCLNTGSTREDSDPLQLEYWEFYIIPTKTINEVCGEAKTISLSRVRKLAKGVAYREIKGTVDKLIRDDNEK